MTKVQSRVMLVLYNVRIVLSNVRKKKRTTKCDKNTVKYDVVLRNVRMILLNLRKKIRESPNVTKIQSHVILGGLWHFTLILKKKKINNMSLF